MDKSFEKAWQKCLDIINPNVTSQSFKTWFEPIKPIKLENSVLTIEVPSQFFYEWLEEHYIDLLRKTIRHTLGTEGRLEYSVVMENGFNSNKPFSVRVPAKGTSDVKNQPLNMPLTVNAGIRRSLYYTGSEEGECRIAIEKRLLV